MKRDYFKSAIVESLQDGEWHSINSLFRALHHFVTPEMAVRRWGRERGRSSAAQALTLAQKVEWGKRRTICHQLPTYVDGETLVVRGEGDQREYRLAGDPQNVRRKAWGLAKRKKS